jgi:hypothetical protein
VQLWVNLPASHKGTPPGYQDIRAQDMGRYNLPDGQGLVRVIAGSYADAQGPARTFSPITLLDVVLQPVGSMPLPIPQGHHMALLLIEGSVQVDGTQTVPTDHFALLQPGVRQVQLTATDGARLLVLGGEPLREPIAAHGPFVMNTREEILQAFEEYQRGAYGQLED